MSHPIGTALFDALTTRDMYSLLVALSPRCSLPLRDYALCYLRHCVFPRMSFDDEAEYANVFTSLWMWRIYCTNNIKRRYWCHFLSGTMLMSAFASAPTLSVTEKKSLYLVNVSSNHTLSIESCSRVLFTRTFHSTEDRTMHHIYVPSTRPQLMPILYARFRCIESSTATYLYIFVQPWRLTNEVYDAIRD